MCSFWILFLQHTTWEASQLFFFPTGPVLKETCHRLITAGPGCVKRKPVIQSEPNPDPPTKVFALQLYLTLFLQWPQFNLKPNSPLFPCQSSCVVRCIRMCFSHYFNNVRLWDRTMPRLHLSWGCLTQSHHPSTDSFFTRRMKYGIVILKPFFKFVCIQGSYFWPFVTCDVDW